MWLTKPMFFRCPSDGSMADILCLAMVSGAKCMKWSAAKLKKLVLLVGSEKAHSSESDDPSGYSASISSKMEEGYTLSLSS